MAITSLQAGASRFAHLVGLSRAAKAEEDENEIKNKKTRAADDGDDNGADDDGDEDDPDDTAGDDREGAKKKGSSRKSGKRAAEDDDGDNDEGDGDPKDAKKSKRGKRAADDDDDDDEADGDPKDARKSKAGKRAADDDDEAEDDDERDPDKEMRGSSPIAKARRREQTRCAAIFACPQAAANLPLAISLAFETRMPRREAIAVLKKGGRASGPSAREAGNPSGMAGDGGSPSVAAKAQGMWASAFERAGVKLGK